MPPVELKEVKNVIISEDPEEARMNGMYYMKEKDEVNPVIRRTGGAKSKGEQTWNPARRPGRFTCNELTLRGRGTGDAAPLMSPVAAKPQDDSLGLHVIDWEEEDGVLLAEDTIKVEVAMDSGAIAHVTPPSCIPRGVEVNEANARNFTAANGGSIKNYGKARVAMTDRYSKQSECVYNVADVTRTLHSTGQVCDQNFEVLYTKKGCVVVPENTLSMMVQEQNVVAKYPRKNGGLYVAEFMVRAPSAKPDDSNTPDFTRRGVGA